MNTAVGSPPDFFVEIPPDSAKTPPWFDEALATPRREGWLDSAGCPIHYSSWGNPANPGVLLLHWFLAHAKDSGPPGSVVIVYGEQSKLFDADSAEYFRECGGEHIPIIGIPDARHHLMLDQPLAFATVLRTILAM